MDWTAIAANIRPMLFWAPGPGWGFWLAAIVEFTLVVTLASLVARGVVLFVALAFRH